MTHPNTPLLAAPLPERPKVARYLSLPILLSPTRSELSARCKRRHWLSDLLQLLNVDAQKSPSALFGTHMHSGAEAFWHVHMNGGDRQDGYKLGLDAIQKSWDEHGPSDFEIPGSKYKNYHTMKLLQECMTTYARNAQPGGGLPGEWEIVELERRRVVNVMGILLPYQIDRLVRSLDDGSLAVIDLKTASSTGPRWHEQMEHSLQQKLYRYAAFADGMEDVKWSCIEGLQKKTVALDYAIPNWSWEHVVEAMDLWLSEAHSDEAFVQMVHAAKPQTWEELREVALETALLSPYFNRQDCFSYYTPCPYLDLCNARPSDRLALASMGYEMAEDAWHDEEAVGLASLKAHQFDSPWAAQ